MAAVALAWRSSRRWRAAALALHLTPTLTSTLTLSLTLTLTLTTDPDPSHWPLTLTSLGGPWRPAALPSRRSSRVPLE